MYESMIYRYMMGNKIYFPRDQYVSVCVKNDDPLKLKEVKVLPHRSEGVGSNKWLLEIEGVEYEVSSEKAKEETTKKFLSAVTIVDKGLGLYLYKNAIIMAPKKHVENYNKESSFDPMFEKNPLKFEDDHLILREIDEGVVNIDESNCENVKDESMPTVKFRKKVGDSARYLPIPTTFNDPCDRIVEVTDTTSVGYRWLVLDTDLFYFTTPIHARVSLKERKTDGVVTGILSVGPMGANPDYRIQLTESQLSTLVTNLTDLENLQHLAIFGRTLFVLPKHLRGGESLLNYNPVFDSKTPHNTQGVEWMRPPNYYPPFLGSSRLGNVVFLDDRVDIEYPIHRKCEAMLLRVSEVRKDEDLYEVVDRETGQLVSTSFELPPSVNSVLRERGINKIGCLVEVATHGRYLIFTDKNHVDAIFDAMKTQCYRNQEPLARRLILRCNQGVEIGDTLTLERNDNESNDITFLVMRDGSLPEEKTLATLAFKDSFGKWLASNISPKRTLYVAPPVGEEDLDKAFLELEQLMTDPCDFNNYYHALREDSFPEGETVPITMKGTISSVQKEVPKQEPSIPLKHVTVNGENPLESVLLPLLEEDVQGVLIYFKTTEMDNVFSLHIVDEDNGSVITIGKYEFPETLMKLLPKFNSFNSGSEIRYPVMNLYWALSFSLK